jgi:hypothetical protein
MAAAMWRRMNGFVLTGLAETLRLLSFWHMPRNSTEEKSSIRLASRSTICSGAGQMARPQLVKSDALYWGGTATHCQTFFDCQTCPPQEQEALDASVP